MAGLLLALIIPVVVSSANAAKPTVGMGTVALVHSQVLSTHQVSAHTTIVVAKNTFMVTGPLSGTAIAIERDVMHTTEKTVMTTFHGMANFTGTLDGKSGMLVIIYQGINNGTFIRGHFEASHGTGDLAGAHGSGHFEGSATAPLNYSIRWTIAPHATDSQTRSRE